MGSYVLRGTSGGGGGTQETQEKVFAMKVTTSGSYKYVAEAEPGSAESSAVWRVFRVDLTTSNSPKTLWADGNDSFDNIATDLTTLSYS